jgi:hypothetical protein
MFKHGPGFAESGSFWVQQWSVVSGFALRRTDATDGLL